MARECILPLMNRDTDRQINIINVCGCECMRIKGRLKYTFHSSTVTSFAAPGGAVETSCKLNMDGQFIDSLIYIDIFSKRF